MYVAKPVHVAIPVYKHDGHDPMVDVDGGGEEEEEGYGSMLGGSSSADEEEDACGGWFDDSAAAMGLECASQAATAMIPPPTSPRNQDGVSEALVVKDQSRTLAPIGDGGAAVGETRRLVVERRGLGGRRDDCLSSDWPKRTVGSTASVSGV